MPPAPLEYSIMVWRRKMGVGYFEAMRMPTAVVLKDIEMMNIEAEFVPRSAVTENGQA